MIKDWKKKRVNEYEMVWENESLRQRIHITHYFYKFKVEKEVIGDVRYVMKSGFKTKVQALTFAMAYMRSH